MKNPKTNRSLSLVLAMALTLTTVGVTSAVTFAADGDVTINETNFPDANFRSYVSSSTVDANTDGTLSQDEISNVKAMLISNKGISDLTGIGNFTSLTFLECNSNSLTTLDVSKCTALTYLDCDTNNLTSLNVSGCTSLSFLDCSDNDLTAIDVSGNTSLTTLYCKDNALTSLDVSGNTSLQNLYCLNNKISTLTLGSNSAVKELDCSFNKLASVDVSGCTSLERLDCEGNVYEVDSLSSSISLASIPGFDASKAGSWTGCTYDSSTNTIGNFTSETITYTYTCDDGTTETFTMTRTAAPEVIPNVTQFLGGSLRIDSSTSAKASLRLGYVIDANLPEGAEIVSWSWKYGYAEDQLIYTAQGEKSTQMSMGRVSNLVLTDIPAAYFKTSYYAQISVVYELNGVQYTSVDDTVRFRNIYDVATAVANASSESASARAYAQGLLDYYNSL